MSSGTSIEDGRVFFLGAGFSASAGLPLTSTLLPKTLDLFRDECPGLYERVSGYAQDVDLNSTAHLGAEDFSRFSTYLDFIELREYGGGERWSEEGSRERLALKFFLAKTIALHSPDSNNIPEHYKNFCLDLTPNDIVVSFNWDTLLEATLESLGMRYSYSFENDAVPIAKLHGSINWIQGPPRVMGGKPFVSDYEPIGASDYLGGLEAYSSRELIFSRAWKEKRPLVGPTKPLIVLPGYGKAVDTRILAPLWYRPEFLAVRRGGVSVIGLGISDDDYLLSSLFRYLFRSAFPSETPTVIINPNKHAQTRFAHLAGDRTSLRHEYIQFDEGALNVALHRN